MSSTTLGEVKLWANAKEREKYENLAGGWCMHAISILSSLWGCLLLNEDSEVWVPDQIQGLVPCWDVAMIEVFVKSARYLVLNACVRLGLQSYSSAWYVCTATSRAILAVA